MGFPEIESVEEAHYWMRRQFGTWPDRPTAEHLSALRSYKGSGYLLMNERLRRGALTRFDEPTLLAVTEAIAAEPISEAVLVYRGIDDAEIVELVLLGAAEIPHKGFVSVTLVREIAMTFTNEDAEAEDLDDATNLLLVGRLNIGSHAAPLDFIPQGFNDNEAELLLHAGSTFVVERVDDSNPDLIEVHGYWREP